MKKENDFLQSKAPKGTPHKMYYDEKQKISGEEEDILLAVARLQLWTNNSS